MEKKVIVKVERKDGMTIISNSYGKVWKVECNDSSMLLASLVGLTMGEFFRDKDYFTNEIAMTLNVSVRDK